MTDEYIDGGAFIGREATDFAGNTLPHEVRVKDSNWNKEPYLPTGEKQSGINGDKLTCVARKDDFMPGKIYQVIQKMTLSGCYVSIPNSEDIYFTRPNAIRYIREAGEDCKEEQLTAVPDKR